MLMPNGQPVQRFSVELPIGHETGHQSDEAAVVGGCENQSFQESRTVWLQRKFIFDIPFGVGDVGDPERFLDHMEQPEEQGLPPEPLQQDHTAAPCGIARTV